MKALILVGGFGTRLRPLTFSKPKPLVEFANKPILWHQVAALVQVGVKEIILAINYQPDTMNDYMKELEKEFSIKVTASIESEPLGTAGPIKLAKKLLTEAGADEDFFVFNSDIICQFPLKKLVDYHKGHHKEGTLMVTTVEDPSRYGVILFNEEGLIQDFIEKPSKPISNKINAGLYLLNKKMIDRIPDKPTSIEREIFPKMAAEKQLYAMVLDGFWMDIGQPADFIKGGELFLDYLSKVKDSRISKIDGKTIIGTAIIDPSAKIAPSAVVGPNVVIGKNCEIGEGVRLANVCVMSGSKIDKSSYITQAIIGWNNKIGKWCRLEGTCIFGEDVVVKDNLYMNGAIVCSHKGVSESVKTPGTILLQKKKNCASSR